MKFATVLKVDPLEQWNTVRGDHSFTLSGEKKHRKFFSTQPNCKHRKFFQLNQTAANARNFASVP